MRSLTLGETSSSAAAGVVGREVAHGASDPRGTFILRGDVYANMERGAQFLLVVALSVAMVAFATFASPRQPPIGHASLQAATGCGTGTAVLNPADNPLVEGIQQTHGSLYLENGTAYSALLYGYSSGLGVPSETIVTFFSPDCSAVIEAYVITAPASGASSVGPGQVAAAQGSPGANSSTGVTLLADVNLTADATSGAHHFTPILFELLRYNTTGLSFT